GDLDAAPLLVEEERHAHAAGACDLLDQARDVLVAGFGPLDVAGADLRPDKLAALLADEPSEGEAPELQCLETLVAEDVVGDRLQIGAGFAKTGRALEGARIGARELERAGGGGDDEVHVLGRWLLCEAVAAMEKSLLLGYRIGAVPRHLLAERFETEPEGERGPDGVGIGVAMRDERDPPRTVQCRGDLVHRPSRSRASRSSAEIRTACSADRSWTNVSSGTNRRSVREPSSRRRNGFASSSAFIVAAEASSSPRTLTWTLALRRSGVISTAVTVGKAMRGSRSSSLMSVPSSR